MIIHAQINSENKIIPLFDSDNEILKRVKKNTDLSIDIVIPRNHKLLKKFMALINTVFQNQTQFTNDKALRQQLLIQAGFYYEVVNEDGTKRPEAMSLSFEAMDEFEFRNVYDRVLDVIVLSYNWSAEEIEENLLDYM